MGNRLTAEKVKKEIHDRIERELRTTKSANLHNLIFEKPWCTGGKGEEVALVRLKCRDSNSK